MYQRQNQHVGHVANNAAFVVVDMVGVDCIPWVPEGADIYSLVVDAGRGGCCYGYEDGHELAVTSTEVISRPLPVLTRNLKGIMTVELGPRP